MDDQRLTPEATPAPGAGRPTGPSSRSGGPPQAGRLPGARRLSDEPDPDPTPRRPVSIDPHQDEAIGGVLRWLREELGTEALAYLHVTHDGDERIMVEPRGLDAQSVLDLARRARDALADWDPEAGPQVDETGTRWSGRGGSNVIVFDEGAAEHPAESLRSAQGLIEGIRALQEAPDGRELENRIRAVPGVAWVEYTPDEPPTLRVLVAEDADSAEVRTAVEGALAGAAVALHWVEPEPLGKEEPRPRLVKVRVEVDTESMAEVHLRWNGHRLEGHGSASASAAGRFHSVAYATADALAPLLNGDIEVEGLYSALTHDQSELLMAVVQARGERLVGAVLSRPGEEDLSAAKAILDAVNRRLPHLVNGNGQNPIHEVQELREPPGGGPGRRS
ncbi:MAG TPA: hypothetical protein VGS09_04255 [Actinomycetota bacterium]|nr:hypothetical protein [Actinomycetota bacterium]